MDIRTAAALVLILAALFFSCFSLTGCSSSGGSSAGSGKSSGTPRKTRSSCLTPEASGKNTVKSPSGRVTVDFSNIGDGYIMIRYTGRKDVQVQITNPDGSEYPYPLTHGKFVAFPLTKGNGGYSVRVLEAVNASNYAVAVSKKFSVKLKNKFSPFLYPSQYVQYDGSSLAVRLARSLSKKSDTDIDFVDKVYDYIINNVDYDKKLAENTPTDYIPDIDKTLRTRTGICFDYASLMTAMMRSQGIPTKLEVGYAGDVYHAWISVYLKDTGWVDDVISFDGKKWTLVDPTLGASNKAEDVKDYISDSSNYTVKYTY
jgi:hypothetical protein